MDKIFVGKITSFHGLKGELKVQSDFELKDEVFKKGFNITIDNKVFEITSMRIHKNMYLITIDSMFDINLIEKYKGFNVYINRDDLKLSNEDFLVNELIDFEVFDKEIYLGKVVKIDFNSVNKFLVVKNEKEFFIPLIEQFIEDIDLPNKKIYTINGQELVL